MQKAINEAPAGAVICLEQGTWHESVFIYKELTIVGVGPEKTIIDGSGWVYQPAAQVTLQGVQISDLWIIGPGSLSLVSSSIAARGFGLVIYGQVTVNIVNSQIAGASLGGIAVLSEGVQLSLINSRLQSKSRTSAWSIPLSLTTDGVDSSLVDQPRQRL